MNDHDNNPEPLAESELMSALLASDLAVEVSAEFTGRRSVGFDVPAATAHVFGRFRAALTSAEDGPIVLIALAALQWREGFLQAVIRDAAVDLIDSGEAINAYRSADSGARKNTRQMLKHLEALLRGSEVREEGGS